MEENYNNKVDQLNLAQKYLESFKRNRIPIKENLQNQKSNDGKISIKAYKKSFASILGIDIRENKSQARNITYLDEDQLPSLGPMK